MTSIERFDATPEPGDDERDAILRAVRAVLDRAARRARPAPWTLGGWPARRTGISDFARHLDGHDAWRLSGRLGWGGRQHTGLVGRGDAR